MTYLDWIAKEGYNLETTVPLAGPETWVRPTKYGHPKCRENGVIVVHVQRDETGTFTMTVTGKTKTFWTTMSAYLIEEAELVTRGRSIEHRLVSAWMEMTS